MYGNQGLNAYQQTSNQAAHYADPHRLVQMLMEGFLTRVASAKGAMRRGEAAAKGTEIGKAISIVDGLRASLDMQRGGELAENLSGLYEYMQGRLLQANLHNDTDRLDEVARLMREIKAGWDGIADEARNQPETAPGGSAGLQVTG
ncbi:MAG: flagellar export chaperone FliS [Ectothiorhodospiraceae bacterium]|nr:flagellar export chaperone FliS [Ectothiorhodospiraceae bacterium]